MQSFQLVAIGENCRKTLLGILDQNMGVKEDAVKRIWIYRMIVSDLIFYVFLVFMGRTIHKRTASTVKDDRDLIIFS